MSTEETTQHPTPQDDSAPTFEAPPSFPILERIIAIWHSLKITDRVIAAIFLALLCFGIFGIARDLNSRITTEIPLNSGSLHEGVVGSPRFVNPVLAVSETDRSLTSLLYAGLTRAMSTGDIVPELAEKYSISEDGKSYTFVIRTDARFHDNTPVTADDVIFTIQKILNPMIKSPRRADWEGVKIEKKDERTIVFNLEKPYAPFLSNTTLGILPKHAWNDLTDEEFVFSNKNIAAIGAGPYSFGEITYDTGGIPQQYTLHSFKKYSLGAPHIQTLYFSFFHNTEELTSAWDSRTIDTQSGPAPERIQSLIHQKTILESAILPRVFGIFLNETRNPILADVVVRKALRTAVNQKDILETVLHGFAVPLTGPLPNLILESATDSNVEALAEANKLLTDAGWILDEATHTRTKDDKILSISLATANNDELKAIAQKISESWQTIGVSVKVELFETGDLNQTVLRPRAFDALLFGEVTGREPDLFAFWHSSQKNDPGLNIAQYSNKKADSELERARTTGDAEEKNALYASFTKRLREDIPAIFIYAPQYIYIHQYTDPHATLAPIMEPYERFSDVHTWYVESERVWNFFAS